MLKASVKEGEYSAFTSRGCGIFIFEEILSELFLFEEGTCPEGVISGHSDPSGWGSNVIDSKANLFINCMIETACGIDTMDCMLCHVACPC